MPTTADDKRKHVDLIQAVITRMNSNSFVIKGWAVTLITAIFAFAGKDEKPQFIVIAFIVLPIFWGLDAYYLSMERRFRMLYNTARAQPETNVDYNMTPPPCPTWAERRGWWISSVLSWTVLPVYLGITAMAFLAHYFLFHSWFCWGK